MMACIANGRGRVTPHLEGARALPPQPLHLSPGTLRAIREGLARVTVGGTAHGQGLDALKVAGKTGTAQTGRSGEPHAWFVGYAPADDPRIVVAVILEHAGTGGEEAGPVAEAVFSRTLALLQGDAP
jgi:cell division protein FtsI/penicillin-binding protein 2